MARKGQITVYLSNHELEVVEQLASEVGGTVTRAAFLRYSLVMGSYVAAKALQEIKPKALALLTVNTLLKTPAGRSAIKVAALGAEHDLEDLTE